MRTTHEIDYNIVGEEMQYVEIELVLKLWTFYNATHGEARVRIILIVFRIIIVPQLCINSSIALSMAFNLSCHSLPNWNLNLLP